MTNPTEADAFDKLGERLYVQIRSLNAVRETEWRDLCEHEREFYRTAAEGLILDWDLLLCAHALQIGWRNDGRSD